MMLVMGGNAVNGFQVRDTATGRVYSVTSNKTHYEVHGPDGKLLKRGGSLHSRVIGALQRVGFPVIK